MWFKTNFKLHNSWFWFKLFKILKFNLKLLQTIKINKYLSRSQVYRYILREFRKLIITFFIVKNTLNLINLNQSKWIKIVNSLLNKFLPTLKHYFYFYVEILSMFFLKKTTRPPQKNTPSTPKHSHVHPKKKKTIKIYQKTSINSLC